MRGSLRRDGTLATAVFDWDFALSVGLIVTGIIVLVVTAMVALTLMVVRKDPMSQIDEDWRRIREH